MANFEVLSLDPTTPQIRAPGAGDGYSVPRDMTFATGTKLGIGATPVTPLFVKATAGGTDPSVVTGERVRIQSNDTTSRSTYLSLIAGTSANSGVFFGDQDAADVGQIRYLHTNDSMQFYTSSAERMRLDTSGNLGIGTTSPSQKLHVASGRIAVTNGFNIGSTDGNTGMFVGTNTVNFQTNGNTVAQFDASGNLGLGVTPSAWWTGSGFVKALQLTYNAFNQDDSGGGNFTHNAYQTGTSSAYSYIATGSASRYRQLGGVHSWHTAGSGSANAAVTFTQAMTLDANGVLMVGSTTPGSDRVRIKASNTTGSSVYSYLNCTNEIDSDLQIRITGSAATDKRAVITTTTNTPIAFGTNDTERGRFTAGGDFLVGKTGTDPTVGAGTIIGLAGATAGALFCTKTETANTSSTLGVYSTGAAAYRFYVGMAGTVYATNTTISAISDQRFKENIQDLDVGLDAILALKPRKFDWKEGKGKDIKGDRGFIAQEIEQVFPDLIDEWKDPAPEGEEPYKSVRQDLIPVLVKAIQELKAELDATKAEVAALKGA